MFVVLCELELWRDGEVFCEWWEVLGEFGWVGFGTRGGEGAEVEVF